MFPLQSDLVLHVGLHASTNAGRSFWLGTAGAADLGPNGSRLGAEHRALVLRFICLPFSVTGLTYHYCRGKAKVPITHR